ncbi:hypothetical protein GCM10017673_41510 [Streptosporangium violaceochromogenes]|nr:hypothetical protein GCM10017673_41510 [Streptosporangium violaceochromogenes]
MAVKESAGIVTTTFGVPRKNTHGASDRRLWDSIPPEVGRLLRPGLLKVTDEVLKEIASRIPEYAHPADETCLQAVREVVDEALRQFAEQIENPGTPWRPEVFRAIGRGEAEEGRCLDTLQTAMRLGARVAWRRLAERSERLGLTPRHVYDLGEAVFAYLDQIAEAAGEGFEEVRAHAAGEAERRRRKLADMLLRQPAAPAETIADLAKAADWRLPKTVAGVALEEPPKDRRSPSLPPDTLFLAEAPGPCLIVPDPDGPGRAQTLEAGLRGWNAAVGLTVPPAEAATSLRWAREALDLRRRGVLDDTGSPLRCSDHLAAMIVLRDERLVDALADIRLAPLAHLRPSQRDRMTETLLAWLRYGRGAGDVAARLHVHPQTVRYRLRRLEELYGGRLDDPEVRFELEIVLRAREAARRRTP